MFNSITSGIHFAVTLTLNLWQWFPRFSPWERDPFYVMFNSITSGIHFAVTLTLNLWQWFSRFSPWERDPFNASITSGIHFAVTLTLNLYSDLLIFRNKNETFFQIPSKFWLVWTMSKLIDIYKRQVTGKPTTSSILVDIYKRQASPFSPSRTTSSLVVSQSVTSLRSLNRQIAKSHLLVRQGLPRAWWFLNRLCHCDLWTDR